MAATRALRSQPVGAFAVKTQDRHYVELRFSDSHVKPHPCRVCRAKVTGVFVAAVRRGGRGEWLWDAHHLPCAAGAQPQLARELYERPKPSALAQSAAALQAHVAHVVLDPSDPCFTRRPLRDVGRLFGLARGGVCALCEQPIEGVALAGPRVDMGRTTHIPFHVACVLETGEVTKDDVLDRVRTLDADQRDLAAEMRRALGVEAAATGEPVTLLGADRRSAKREDLVWELWFVRPPDRARAEALVRGDWSWELPTIARIRPAPKATTLAFRDAVVTQAEALAAEGLYGASFCGAGDRALARARALVAAGRLPYPFPFVGRGQLPRGELRVRVRLREGAAAQPSGRTFDRWFADLHRDGTTLSFRARYGVIPPDAPYLDALRAGLDDVLLELHTAAPIALALLGDGDGPDGGDAWHEDSLARVTPALLAELRGAAEVKTPLSVAELERLRRAAIEAHAHAEEMGDPKAAWEGLEALLAEIPPDQTALRAEVHALLDDLVDVVAPAPRRR